ncbi:MAG: T9SS type A sorting domain-containing protein [Parafilimonas sp.]|nr:T9SS type A sorting domain-containing protein [Parafilimonas sp.]
MPIQLNWLNSAPSYLNGGSFSAQGVTNLSDGSVVVVGYFQHTVDFDPGPDTFNLTTTAYYGIFVAKYTNQGKLAFAYGFSESNPLFFDENFESANAVTADADDNIYVTGSFRGTVDFDPDSDKAVLSTGGVSGNNFIACYTKNGKLKFAKDITKGTGEFVESYSIALDKQKNIYVTGVFQGSSVDFDPGPDSTKFSAVEDDIFFAKYDSAGNYIFAKTLGGDKNDEVGKIAVDSKKNILICGGFASGSVDFDPGIAKHILKRNGSKEEMFFAKYDSMGNYVFAKNVGNYQTNFANSIAVDKNDGFVLTGYFYGTNVDFDINNPGTHLLTSNGTNDIFVARYNSSGSCVFAFNIGNAGGGDNGLDIAFDSNQNIICTGAYGGSNVDFDPSDKVYKIKSAKSNNYYIAEYNYNGNFLSAVGLNGGVYADDFQVICLHVTIANKILVGGFYKDSFDADAGPDSTILTAPAATMFVAKYDNEENFLGVIHGDNYYDYTFPYINVSSSAIDKKGNIYVCGHFEGSFDFDPGKNKHILASTENIYGSESQNSFFAKYDKNGNLIFAKGITGGDNFANDIAVDNKENIYLTGLCDGFTDFDPDSNVYFLNKSDTAQPYKYYNYFIAKYDVNGNLVYAKGDGNGLSIFFKVSSIALDTKSNICIAGVLDKSIDFDPGPNKHILNGGDGLGNMFIAKYDSAGNYAFAYCIKSSNSRGGINDLKFDNKNNIIVTGTFSGTNVDFNPGPNNFLLSSGNIYDEGFISKYKNDGSFINAIDIDGQDYSYSNFSHLTTDSLNNIYIAGSSTKAADFDPGPDSAHLTQAHETFFASYNNKLQFRFLKGLEGLENYNSYTEQNSLNSIVLDKNNNIYVAGQFTSAYIDCDAGPDTALLRNKNLYGNVLFLAKYDTVGNYIYSFEFTGDSAQGNNSSAAIMVDTDGKIDYTGTFKVKINFGLGTKKQYAIPTTNHGDIFIAQYKPALAQSAIATAQNASREINDNTVKIYPNPITDKINIQLNNIEQNNSTAIISLYDVNGKCLKTNEAAIINHNLNSSIILPQNLISGNYFIEIKIGEKRYFSDALVK